jgi:uncharacterized coiled-coil DUF342 family protein
MFKTKVKQLAERSTAIINVFAQTRSQLSMINKEVSEEMDRLKEEMLDHEATFLANRKVIEDIEKIIG